MGFFRAALDAARSSPCPGEFFDVNPGKRRQPRRRRASGSYVRFSFGPAIETLETALDRLEQMIGEAAPG